MDDPSHSSVDVSVSTFLRLLLPDARSMTRSIMSGIICPPKVFVQRTLRRMRLLPKLNVLAHLSRLPPCTMEIENMGILSNIAGIRGSRGLYEVHYFFRSQGGATIDCERSTKHRDPRRYRLGVPSEARREGHRVGHLQFHLRHAPHERRGLQRGHPTRERSQGPAP
ncbi:hypothetical protein FA13DRAFT_142484 [Coprinellus micaceus]|uniref:Uncharacterized protein n=1 Tax=Coprinellus micaceus TaxID=71717 RepID=A0A4Y7SJ24_COPMI|nr:hypothetical protein FA13DRAFT_142484 [Coprinellus micaceus]